MSCSCSELKQECQVCMMFYFYYCSNTCRIAVCVQKVKAVREQGFVTNVAPIWITHIFICICAENRKISNATGWNMIPLWHFSVIFAQTKCRPVMLCLVPGFMASCFRAWWTVMRTRWTALEPAWCPGSAQRWPCLFSCCRASPAHPPLWLQLLPSQLEWRAVGAGAFPWVPICTRSSLICEAENLPVALASGAQPAIAPNF